MMFTVLTLVLAFFVAVILGLAALRARDSDVSAADYDLRVYRDQLKEVDRDLARGIIGEADAERIRAEISRRILAADAQSGAAPSKRQGPARLALGVAMGAALMAGSWLIYDRLGAPGYGDLALADRIERAEAARSERPSQAQAEASLNPAPRPDLSPDFIALMEQLRGIVAQRPDDLRGHQLLARNEAAAGNYADAHAAQAQVLRIKGASVEASDWADYADMLILSAGGYVSPEAEQALARTLEIEPDNPVARYYTGLMMGQIGRPDTAFRIWEDLLVKGPADAPWIAPIRSQIEEMAFRAGQHNFVLPPEDMPRGPTAADIEAAGDMTPEERMTMIEGMVAGLSDRLATEGGPPEDWARLIGALGVLGDEAQAIAIYNNALEVFAGNDAALNLIREGARRAALIP
ncbi:MAG: c-type cytochrome biogenesis protein CcmI [Rhodobacteraceae bacterium]|nr:c-type cytochrome biogenesis protein CcmI [Paracoccaceae bacterium]